MPEIPCALCGQSMPRERIYISHYCSVVCAMTVAAARSAVGNALHAAIRSGVIPPARSLTCVDCGAPATDYDHRHYLDPLNVVPTCRSCNLKRGPALDIADLVLRHFDASGPISEFMHGLKRRHEEEREARLMHLLLANSDDIYSAA